MCAVPFELEYDKNTTVVWTQEVVVCQHAVNKGTNRTLGRHVNKNYTHCCMWTQITVFLLVHANLTLCYMCTVA